MADVKAQPGIDFKTPNSAPEPNSTTATESTLVPVSKKHKKTSSLNDKKHVKSIESTVSGATAGLLSRFVIAPLDVVKIRMQLEITQIPHKGHHGRVIYDKLINIAKNEGIQALFKGNVPAEIMYIAYGASQFTTYKWTSTSLSAAFPNVSEHAISFVSGSSSAVVATTLTYPFDLLRTRFAIQATPGNNIVYPSLRYAIWHIYKNEGVNGFFRGLTPAVMAMVPYMGLFFSTYQHIYGLLNYVIPAMPTETTNTLSSSSNTLDSKTTYSLYENKLNNITTYNYAVTSLISLLHVSQGAVAGFISGVISKTTLFPLDVIRKRLQVQGPTRAYYLSGTIPIYPRNPIATAVLIVRNEGLMGLYKGLLVSIIKSAPASAVTMWTYEHTLEAMRFLKAKGYLSY